MIKLYIAPRKTCINDFNTWIKKEMAYIRGVVGND